MDYAAVDDEGFVLATANCPDPPPPYSVCESSKYPGRYFFYNSETRQSQWRLAQWLAEANEKGALKTASPAEIFTPKKTTKPTITADGITVVGGLGQGGYGVVVSMVHDVNGRPRQFAMKCVSKSRSSSKKDETRLRRELRALTELPPSPFLMTSYLCFESRSTVFFVTNLISGGDLFYHLDMAAQEGLFGFPENEARILIAETAVGLCHMHDHNMIHRDIKVENVMLGSDGHVKLVDYGLCCEVGDKDGIPMSPVGSLIYMAPELLVDTIGGRFTDWWALGVLAHELLTGRSVWTSLTDKRVIKREIVKVPLEQPLQGMSSKASEFVSGLLSKDRKERIGYHKSREVLEHRFFADFLNMTAVEQGETPPASINCGSKKGGNAQDKLDEEVELDQEEALKEYRAMRDSEPVKWSMHLHQVDQHPRCPDRNQPATELGRGFLKPALGLSETHPAFLASDSTVSWEEQ
mmetsp:Transcript_59099/g.111605  ORF Transcript_59099/g.111605 Transcript_59099/m.111605 type:complete len:466 (+) Transcript_59099:129-1526(+)